MPCNASQPIRLSELLYVNKAIDFLQKKEPKVLVVVMEICLKELSPLIVTLESGIQGSIYVACRDRWRAKNWPSSSA